MAYTKRLIDANAFKQSLEIDRFGYTDIVKVNIALDKATVDAVEVVHGRWLAWKEKLPKVVLIDTKRLGVFCSVCNMHNDYMSNYCPNCGAKMDGGNEDA